MTPPKDGPLIRLSWPILFARLQRFQHGRDGKVQRHKPADKTPKSKMLVKRGRRCILGIYNQSMDGGIRTRRAAGRVDDESASQPAPAESLIDSEATDQTSGQQSMARQPFGILRRDVREWEAGSREGVIRGDRSSFIAGDKAVADSPANILCRQFAKIAVQRGYTAGEFLAIMDRAEWFDAELVRHYTSSLIRRRWA
jgi:hypothetical protein